MAKTIEELERIRVDKGFETQRDLAQAMGITYQHYNRTIRKRTKLSVKFLLAFCKATHTKYATLSHLLHEQN